MSIFDDEKLITRELLKECGYHQVYDINEEYHKRCKNYYINIHRAYKYREDIRYGEFYWIVYILNGGYDRWRNKVLFQGEIKTTLDLIAIENLQYEYT